MLEVDDTVDTMESDANCMFRDAEWGAFDQDWIRVMCEKPEDEVPWTSFPSNTTSVMQTIQYERLFFRMDRGAPALYQGPYVWLSDDSRGRNELCALRCTASHCITSHMCRSPRRCST